MMTAPAVIEARGITRSFPGPPPVDALQRFEIRVERGERVALMGPSGAGKSTALNILGLLDRPTRGSVHLDGVDTSSLSDAQLTVLRGRSIGFVFQSFHLVPYRTVTENVAMGLLYTADRATLTRSRIETALREVGLSHRADAKARTLSGGESQRVAIARAIIHRPRLLMADEPTGNLDSERSEEIQALLSSLVTEDSAQIVVTHDPDVAARMDRIVRVIDGRTQGGSDDEHAAELGERTPA